MKAKPWGATYIIAIIVEALADFLLTLPMILGVMVSAMILTRREEMDLIYWLTVIACACTVFTIWAAKKIAKAVTKRIDKRAKKDAEIDLDELVPTVKEDRIIGRNPPPNYPRPPAPPTPPPPPPKVSP